MLAKSRKNLENYIEWDGIWNPIENQGISNTISNDIFLDVIFEIFLDFALISKWFFENQNIIFFDDLKKNNVVKVMCCRFRAKNIRISSHRRS